jgi:regulatory protein
MTSHKDPSRCGNNQNQIKEHIYRLLKYRERSVKEVRDRLKAKHYRSEEIQKAINDFLELDLLNDTRFTAQWVRWRLAKPYGVKRIAVELRKKGIDQETIQSELAKATASLEEERVVYDLAQKRLSRYQYVTETKKLQRIYGYLYRRGFGAPAIYRVLNRLKDEWRNDSL